MVVVRSGKEQKKKLEDFYRNDLLEDFDIFAQAALFVNFFPLNTQMFHYHEKVSLGISSPLMPFREDSMALCPLSSIFVGTVVKKWRQASFVSYRFCRLFSIIINVVCFIPAIGILDGHCSNFQELYRF
jgi:hypothetical protein